MKPMLDCDTVMRQLWAYLDQELTEDRMEAIREHLAVCARCFPQLEFERTFLEQLGKLRREHPNPQTLRTRLVAALAAEGFTAF